MMFAFILVFRKYFKLNLQLDFLLRILTVQKKLAQFVRSLPTFLPLKVSTLSRDTVKGKCVTATEGKSV